MKHSDAKKDFWIYFASVAIIILINYLGNLKFTRIDLTSEKRYTLSDSTIAILQRLDDIVTVKCYLDGDLNSDFQRLRNSTEEILGEFRAWGGNNLEYEFINPMADPDPKEQEKMKHQLAGEGIIPTRVSDAQGESKSEVLIFPGCMMYYKGREVPVNLLKSQMSRDPLDVLNESVEGLEYEFAKAIYILQRGEVRKTIAFSRGHGELTGMETVDLYQSINELYNVKKAPISNNLNAIPSETKVLIVAKPDSSFGEASKYVIDQFIMQGGRVLWLIDNVFTSIDSLYASGGLTAAIPSGLNLDDQFFKYGFRINTDLVMDERCGKMAVQTGSMAGKPNTEFKPWYYYPICVPQSNSIITNNINNVRLEFASSIDTLKSQNIKYTVLLNSSDRSRSVPTPSSISLETTSMPVNDKLFNKKNIPLALLLEGKFTSVFKNRLSPKQQLNASLQPVYESPENKMIVVSDGDIARNYFDFRQQVPLALGFNPLGREYQPGNKTFLLNCINYLMDDTWLIPLRTKQFKIRLLDRKKVQEEASHWRLINTVVPVLLILIFGILWFRIRKYKYGRL